MKSVAKSVRKEPTNTIFSLDSDLEEYVMVKKKSRAQLKSVTLKLPWMDLAWQSDESEVKALRDLVNQLRSRRAFQMNRGMLAEEPVYFIDSVLEMRSEVRKILSQLPVNANEARVLLLSVMDWLAQILDRWSADMTEVNPDEWNFVDSIQGI